MKKTSKIDISSLPDLHAPGTALSLKEAVSIVNSHAVLLREELPETVEQARDMIVMLRKNTPHEWLTGDAALAVLNAYLGTTDNAAVGA